MTLLQLTKKAFASTLNNIAEISSGKLSKNISKMLHGKRKQEVLCHILNAYKTHPSIKQMENKFNEQKFFRQGNFSFKSVLIFNFNFSLNRFMIYDFSLLKSI